MVDRDQLQEILAVLCRTLTLQADLFEKGSPKERRSSLQISLAAIESVLTMAFGVNDSKSFMPLRQLSYALEDLNRGKVVPLLTPQKRSRRPPDSISKEAFMASAAACMELFVEAGVARKAAARRVANNLHAQGYSYDRAKRITAQNVEDWRDRMRTGSASEDEAVGRFRRMVDQYRSEFPDPQKKANWILERISLLVPPEIPRTPPLKWNWVVSWSPRCNGGHDDPKEPLLCLSWLR
jgi:hypothetical protein